MEFRNHAVVIQVFNYRSGLNRIFSETAADTITQGTTLALLWVGGTLVLHGALTLGEVLVLDEGTAALDAEAEAVVHRCLLGRRDRGMTIILISHRPQSLAIADHHIHLTPIHEKQPLYSIH